MQLSAGIQVNTTGFPLWLQKGSSQEEIHVLGSIASQKQVEPIAARNLALKESYASIFIPNKEKKSLSVSEHYRLEFLHFIYSIYYSMGNN